MLILANYLFGFDCLGISVKLLLVDLCFVQTDQTKSFILLYFNFITFFDLLLFHNIFIAEDCINQPVMVLKGHRSIVNQIRYNHHAQAIVSSGVEKVIKVKYVSLWLVSRLTKSMTCILCPSDRFDVICWIFSLNSYLCSITDS